MNRSLLFNFLIFPHLPLFGVSCSGHFLYEPGHGLTLALVVEPSKGRAVTPVRVMAPAKPGPARALTPGRLNMQSNGAAQDLGSQKLRYCHRFQFPLRFTVIGMLHSQFLARPFLETASSQPSASQEQPAANHQPAKWPCPFFSAKVG